MAWHSRRGMLELDLLLVPFVRNRLPHLDSRQQRLYQQLLTEEDQDLFLWLMRRAEPPDSDLKEAVELVLEDSYSPARMG